MTGARSVRFPWVRAGLMPLVVALLPLAWVVETDSCGQAPRTVERTGVEIIGTVEPAGGALLLLLFAVLWLTPWVAGRVSGGLRLFVHVLGAAVSGFLLYGAFFALFFSLFSQRALKAAGGVVLAVFIACFGDAVVRLVLGVREWWRARPRS